MKTKIVLILVATSAIFLSCKKEDTSNSNIVHKSLNKQINVNSSLFDTAIVFNFNDDVATEFFMRIVYTSLSRESNYSLFFASDDSRNQWLVNEVSEDAIAKKLPLNTLIDSSSNIWSGSGLLYRKYSNSGSVLINYTDAVGVGDVLIGIRFIIDEKYHYGWLKVAVSADFKSIMVNEVAYNKLPNIPIKAGAF